MSLTAPGSRAVSSLSIRTYPRLRAPASAVLVAILMSMPARLPLAFAAEPSAALSAPAPKAEPKLGMNLAGPADWSTELPFVDVFRLSRPWISQRRGEPWGRGPRLELDQHGWVQRLEADCWAETLMLTIEGGHYPGGAYTVLYEGNGQIDFSNAGTVRSREPGRIVVDVDPGRGALFLQLRATDPADPVRNIRVIMPGFEKTYRDDPFHPAFLRRWQGVACFRFMDWMKTNGSKIEHWADRPTPDSATFSEKGVALEWMIDLCNRQQADAWFCMPHLADDDYVRRFAEMVRDRLDPKLRVYVEYSNEVWNSQFQFPQTRHSWEKAKQLQLGPPERPWEGGAMYYARRSVEIFKIWEQVFGGADRLVRVLAWQAGNAWWMDNIVLPFEDAYRHADALAIAPYIGMSVPAEGKELRAADVAGWSLDRLFEHLETDSLPRAIRAMEATKTMADKYGLNMVAYEGGQHLVGVAGGENNDALTALFHRANADPRMGQMYRTYYDAWERNGGDLFCYFSSVGRWSKWGSWGILQYADDDPRQSPKFLSTFERARRWGQKVNLP